MEVKNTEPIIIPTVIAGGTGAVLGSGMELLRQKYLLSRDKKDVDEFIKRSSSIEIVQKYKYIYENMKSGIQANIKKATEHAHGLIAKMALVGAVSVAGAYLLYRGADAIIHSIRNK